MFDPDSAEPPTDDQKSQPIAERGWFWRLALLLGVSVGGLILYNLLTRGTFFR